MSHFFLMVLTKIPENLAMAPLTSIEWQDFTEEAIDELEARLAPFSENKEVPTYERKCFCVGSKAAQEVRAQVDQELGTYDDLRVKFRKLYPKVKDFSSESDDLWFELCKPRGELTHKLFAQHPAKDKATPDCYECKGKGVHPSTFNPIAKWDWYCVGGRFSDLVSEDAARVSDILDNWNEDSGAFAVLTPTGEWIERGKMLMFGFVQDKVSSKEWGERVKAILEQHRDCIAVGVDCHV